MAATGPADLDLSDDVAHVIDHTPIPTWRLPAASHGAVRAVAAATREVLPDVAGALVGGLAGFYADMAPSVWTFDEAAAVLTADETDKYIAARARTLHPAVAAGRHSLLAVAGSAVNPDGWPARTVPEPGPWVFYSHGQAQALYRSLDGLPWLDATRTFGVLTIGLSTGASEDDLAAVSADDIHVGADGQVRVTLPTSGRTVPTLWPYRRALTRLAINRRAGSLSGVGPMNRSALTGLPERIATDGVPRLVLSRLRATWLAAHLSAGTPLHLLGQVAGPSLLDDIARVLPHLDRNVSPAAARRWLTIGG